MTIFGKPRTYLFKFLHKYFENKGLWKIPFVPNIYEFFYRLTSNKGLKTVIVNGFKITVFESDSGVSKHLILHDRFEKYELDLFCSSINEGDTVVDIGANLGLYTLFASKVVGNTGVVYSFEPDHENLAILKRNVTQNGLKNVSISDLALSNVKGSASLYINKYSKGSQSLIESNVPHKKGSIDVVTTSLDDFFSNIKNDLNCIKIDVEGFEPYVLEGAKKLFKQKRIIKIFIEYVADLLPKESNIINLLEDNNFAIYIINSSKKTLIRTSSGEFDYNYSGNLYCELVN